ncbi:MAG: hypothetical protein R3A78_11035 [Polyangiales bacterium]
MSTVLDATKVGDARVAEVWGFEPKKYRRKGPPKLGISSTTFLIVAAKHALEDAGLQGAAGGLRPGADRHLLGHRIRFFSMRSSLWPSRSSRTRDINPAKFPNDG